MVAILEPSAPNTALAFPPFAKGCMIAGFCQVDAILEKIKVDGEAQLMTGFGSAIAVFFSKRTKYPSIPVGIAQGDFVAHSMGLIEQPCNHPCKTALFLSKSLVHRSLRSPCGDG